jgi:transposase
VRKALQPEKTRFTGPLGLAVLVSTAEVMMTDSQKRFVGLDTHKQYVMVGAVNATQEVVLSPRKVSLAELEGWAKKQLRPTDAVVLEATSNAWYFYDLLEPLGGRVVVGHPPHIKLIAAALVKTDKKDTMTLAKFLAVGLIPPVWVPPQQVRELRALISHRQRLISQQSRTKNRLRSLLQRQHIGPTGGELFSQANRAWWLKLDLSSSEQLGMRQDLLMLDHLSPLIQEVEAEIQRLSMAAPWAEPGPQGTASHPDRSRLGRGSLQSALAGAIRGPGLSPRSPKGYRGYRPQTLGRHLARPDRQSRRPKGPTTASRSLFHPLGSPTAGQVHPGPQGQ